MPLDAAKYQKRQSRESDGICECVRNARSQDIGRERDQSADEIRDRNRPGADRRALWIRLFQTKLKAHHEVEPALAIRGYCGNDRRQRVTLQAVAAENGRNLLNLAVAQVV